MAKRSQTPLIEPLSDSEFDELEDLLLSEDLPEACMDTVTLEGLLTAIAIGPVPVTPEHCLPQVFGSDLEDPMPDFPSIKDVERPINLILSYYNSVLTIFEVGPEKFHPRFYIHEVEGKTYTIVDEWCSGFLKGIALAGDAWQPLLDEQPGILRPSSSSPQWKVGPNWMRRRTRRRCMLSGRTRLSRTSRPCMIVGYPIQRALEKT